MSQEDIMANPDEICFLLLCNACGSLMRVGLR